MTMNKNGNGTSILPYNGTNITFELANGDVMVNLTEMAKAFGKRPNDFLSLPSANELIRAITRKSGNSENQVVITKAGSSEFGGGTWANRLVALSFAQWLSVDFHLICLEMIEGLLFDSPKPIRHRSLPRSRADYRAWYEVVSPWLGYEEVGRVAAELGVTVCHVRKVLRGTSASQSVIDALGLVAYDNHNRGYHPPRRRNREAVDYRQTLDLFGWAPIAESEVVL